MYFAALNQTMISSHDVSEVASWVEISRKHEFLLIFFWISFF